MRRFTEEELKKLSVAEQHFNTCRYGQYKRATTNKMDTMVADIWDAAMPEQPTARKFSCGKCSFNMYLKVGNKYFEDKAVVSMELEPKSVTDTLSATSTDNENNKATNKKRNGKTKTK